MYGGVGILNAGEHQTSSSAYVMQMPRSNGPILVEDALFD